MMILDIALLDASIFSQLLISPVAKFHTSICNIDIICQYISGWLRHLVIQHPNQLALPPSVLTILQRYFPKAGITGINADINVDIAVDIKTSIGQLKKQWKLIHQKYQKEQMYARSVAFSEFRQLYLQEYTASPRLTAYAYSKEPELLKYAKPKAALQIMEIYWSQIFKGRKPIHFPLHYMSAKIRNNPKFIGQILKEMMHLKNIPKKGSFVSSINSNVIYTPIKNAQLDTDFILSVERIQWY